MWQSQRLLSVALNIRMDVTWRLRRDRSWRLFKLPLQDGLWKAETAGSLVFLWIAKHSRVASPMIWSDRISRCLQYSFKSNCEDIFAALESINRCQESPVGNKWEFTRQNSHPNHRGHFLPYVLQKSLFAHYPRPIGHSKRICGTCRWLCGTQEIQILGRLWLINELKGRTWRT